MHAGSECTRAANARGCSDCTRVARLRRRRRLLRVLSLRDRSDAEGASMTLKAQAYAGAAGYFIFRYAAISYALQAGKETNETIATFYAIFALGYVSLMIACSAQARMKGYSGWLA